LKYSEGTGNAKTLKKIEEENFEADV